MSIATAHPMIRRSASRRPAEDPVTVVVATKSKRRRMSKCHQRRAKLLDLPDELLLIILQHLTPEELAKRVSPVCKRLRAICSDASLFRSLTLPKARPKSASERRPILDLLLRRPQLRRLEVVGRTMTDSTRVASFALAHCSDLEYLELRMCNVVDPKLLEAVSRHGQSLVEVTLHHTDLRLGLLECKAGCLRRLTSLTLYHCHGLTGQGLIAIGHHCKNLVHFAFLAPAMETLPVVSSAAVSHFLDSVSSSIKRLQFGGSEGQSYSFQNLAKCLQLEVLELLLKTNLDLPILKAISSLTGLKRLALQTCSLSDSDFCPTFINRKLGGITSLELAHCNLTDEGLRTTVQNCPLLERLYLRSCTKLVVIKDALINCPQLRKLHVYDVNLTYASFIQLPSTTKITSLHLANCWELSNSAMKSIATYCPELCSLVLLNCSDFIGDRGIRSILKKCKQLRKLHLSNSNVTKKAFYGQQNLNLRKLVLDGCHMINNTGVKVVAESCQKLEFLRLGPAGKLTDSGVRLLLNELMRLETIELFGTWRVTPAAFLNVAARPRYLKVNFLHQEQVKQIKQFMPGCEVTFV